MIFTREKPQEVTSVATAPTTIRSYLAERSILIESTGVEEERYRNQGLAAFAIRLAELQLNGGTPIIKYLRHLIVTKNNKCCFCLCNLKQEERQASIDIANLLCSVGALVNVNEHNNTLYATFDFSSKRFIAFFTGDFLEIAIYSTMKRILTEHAEYEETIEILPNVITSHSNGNKREYDILARLGNDVFVIEIKSGNSEKLNSMKQKGMGLFAYYKQRGMEIGCYPHHQMIVIASHSTEEMQCQSYFEECSIANFNTFEEKLKQMIKK